MVFGARAGIALQKSKLAIGVCDIQVKAYEEVPVRLITVATINDEKP